MAAAFRRDVGEYEDHHVCHKESDQSPAADNHPHIILPRCFGNQKETLPPPEAGIAPGAELDPPERVLGAADELDDTVSDLAAAASRADSASGRSRPGVSGGEQRDAIRRAQISALIGCRERRGVGADREELPRARYAFELVLSARLQGDP
jgi:hypothetical protein